MILVALLAAGAGGVMPPLLLRGGDGEGKGARKSAEREPPAYVPLFDSGGDKEKSGGIVANLRSPGQTRFLKVNITLVTDKSEGKRLAEMVKEKKAVLMNAVLTYLSDRTVDEIRGMAGMNRIRRELLDQLNILLYPDGSEKIRDLLFLEFNTQ